MTLDRQAGFFSNGYGVLPWIWTNGIIERVSVVRVK